MIITDAFSLVKTSSSSARARRAVRCLLALTLCLLAPAGGALRAQQVVPAEAVLQQDPAQLFLKAYTSVTQGETLEANGRLKNALSKYRYAASLLEQIGQNNPNWQPPIISYRLRRTAESIRKLEQKIYLMPQVAGGPGTAAGGGAPSVSVTPGAPDEAGGGDDPLPQADEPMPGLLVRATTPTALPTGAFAPTTLPPPPEPSRVTADRATQDLSAKLEKLQKELKAAVEQRDAAQKDRQQAVKDRKDIEFQLHKTQTDAASAQKRAERAVAVRHEAEDDLEKAQKRYNEAIAKNPDATETRKELRDQVKKLKDALAKADADAKAATKDKDALQAQLAKAQESVATVAAASGDADKIAALQAENTSLTQKLAAAQQKLTTAETHIAELSAESARKKDEVTGMQKELQTFKEQLFAARDQNDRSATTVTELRTQLAENAQQIDDMKARGMTNEDITRMSSENSLLRGIVLRQMKDQARRTAAKELITKELARLEVQSKTLSDQVEILGQPTPQLTDQERELFKAPQIAVSSGSDPSSLTASITVVKPGAGAPPASSPAADPGALPAPAADGSPAVGNLTAPPSPEAAPADTATTSSGPDNPKVETTSTPKVSAELMPKAREAKEALDRSQYADAEKLYEKLLALDPKNPYLLSMQGVVLFRQNKLNRAEIMLKKAAAIAPNDAYCQATLGIIYYRQHNYDAAITALTKAITLDPKNATAHNYLGITSSQKGWPEAAEDEIKKALALNPNYADAHFNIAVIYATSQPPSKAQAQEHYKRATELGAAPDSTLEKLLK